MTIKQRLILSHLTVFIVPILATLLVILVSAVALVLFARSGNHIYIETNTEFQNICHALHHLAFHDIEDESENSIEHLLIGLLAPEENYIAIHKDERIIFLYGNQSLQNARQPLTDKMSQKMASWNKESSYANATENYFVYIEKQIIDGQVYWLHFVSEKASHDKDEELEDATRRTFYFAILSLIVFVAAASLILSRFILHSILLPLNKLREGAGKIREGDLTLQLEHNSDDEIKPVMEAFNLMAQRLSESLKESQRQEESRKELIASISHDLRTPLTTIKAYVEGLIDHIADTPEKQDRYYQVIKKKADELNNLIEQLFLFSKIALGEKAIPLEKINLKEMLEFFVSENNYTWKKAGAKVRLDIEENVIIMGSFLLLGRILSNIISNSIKYKPEYEVECLIKLHIENGNAVLSIQDNGVGVPEESLQRLIEPFYRTDKARSRTEDGTGLGLSIAFRAVEMMRGTMIIKNVSPHGLMVTIELPVLGVIADETENIDNRR